jgi:hypothetical protein
MCGYGQAFFREKRGVKMGKKGGCDLIKNGEM